MARVPMRTLRVLLQVTTALIFVYASFPAAHGIRIIGTSEYVKNMGFVLLNLQYGEPEYYDYITERMSLMVQMERWGGYLTAGLPIVLISDKHFNNVWYLQSILIHEACHLEQRENGLHYDSIEMMEMECYGVQMYALVDLGYSEENARNAVPEEYR